MRVQGINANIMSLGGIAIAVGVMVDAAIVMIENAHKSLENKNVFGEKRWELIKQSAIKVGPSLFFSLLVITLSFMPVFSLQAQEGRLFAPLAFTKTYAMAASCLVSITLVPVLMGYFIRGRLLSETKNPINRVLVFIYKPLLKIVLNHPKKTLALLFSLFILTIYPFKQLGSEFMPELDEGDWMYMPSTLPGISTGKARQLLQQTDELIASLPEVARVFGKVGRAKSATDPAPLSMIETIIQFKPESQWRPGMTREKLKETLNELTRLPGLTNAWVMPIKGRIDMLATGTKTALGLKISGRDLKSIQALGTQLESLLKKVPGTLSAYADRVVGGRYVIIDIDRLKAARFGLNIKDIQMIISAAVGGMTISETIEGRERYPINLRYPQRWRDSEKRLNRLPIITNSGAQITLSDVANVSIEEGPPVIKSENGQLTGWVLIDLEVKDIETYVKKAQSIIDQSIRLPTGYTLSWSGQYEYIERAKAQLSMVVPLTLAIIFLLLYINFRNIGETFLVMGTLPFALIGSVWFLYWLGYNVSVAVAVGMIGLAGIAVEIGVVMLMYLNLALEKRNKNHCPLSEYEVKEAVLEGALLRIRPILMTVASTVIGLVPVMVGTGTGSEVMRRIAAPMVGGMISAAVLTLFALPAIFYLWKRRA
jgi:Cu(I)/Ag(I) efflux system membrane protein CusA/SilA